MKYNVQNLVQFTSDQNREEASKNGRKGGIASGEAKRRRKQIRENTELLLSLPVKSLKNKAQLESLGIKEEDMTNQMAMIIGVWQKAVKGDVQAFNSLRDTIGEKPKEVVEHQGEINNPYSKLTEEELKKLAGE